MDLILVVAVLALLVLAGLFVAVLRAKTEDVAGGEQRRADGPAGRAAGTGPARLRRRGAGGTGEEGREGSGGGASEADEEEAKRQSAKQAARAQAKAAKKHEAAMREAEKEARKREDDKFWVQKRRESEQSKTEQQREQEEEARLAAEMERREKEELELWRGQMEVEDSGLAVATEDERRRVQDEMVEAIKTEKVRKRERGEETTF